MFSIEFIKIFFFCFYLIIQIKSQLYGYYDSASYDDTNQETSDYNVGKDFGPCDLHRGLCDFDCCCDEDCNDDQKKRFTFDCYNDYHPKHINDKFKCQNLKKTYEYYKNRSHENNVYSYHNNEDLNKYHDHIFGLMCMKYDRTGDIGEFYKEFEGDDKKKKDKLDEYHKNYINFFNKDIDSDILEAKQNNDIKKINELKAYKKLSSDILLYQSDSFGNCIKTLKINYLKPVENIECGMISNLIREQNEYIINEFLNNYECIKCFIFSDNNKILNTNSINHIELKEKLNSNYAIKEFHITVEFKLNDNDNYEINKFFIKSLIVDSSNKNRIKQKFSVNFINDFGNYKYQSGLPGYLINKPVLFKSNDDVFIGIQIQGADPNDGKCLKKGSSILNINDPYILFKVDTIYTCKLENVNMNTEFEIEDYKIFNNINENDEVGKYGFTSTDIYNNVYIKINKEINENNNKEKCENFISNSKNYKCLPITQFFEIIVSKFGRKGSSQEYIYDIRLFTKYEPIEFDFQFPYNDYKDIELKFIVKFISINEGQFERNFENGNYITSLIPLPEDVKRNDNDDSNNNNNNNN